MICALLCLLFASTSLVRATTGHQNHPPVPDHPCDTAYDCPYSHCYEIDCVNSLCAYARQSIQECCLENYECCPFAQDNANETAKCVDYECQFIPSVDPQCKTDEACQSTLAGLYCASQGECHVNLCLGGLCDCINGTGEDWDNDEATCPGDCDDANPLISKSITCIRDDDNDDYPACPLLMTLGGPDDDDGDYCLEFCVEADATCPLGYTDVSDPWRFEKYASTSHSAGVQCGSGNTPDFDEELCDCCDIDDKAFPNSTYAANTPNKCGNADYNCNDMMDEVACCGEGDMEYLLHHNRWLWDVDECVDVTDQCGGCSTVNSTAVLVEGWGCEENCTIEALEDLAFTQVLSTGHIAMEHNGCPQACGGECVCTDVDTQPVLGQCAKLVNHCIEVRDFIYGDGESCCIRAVA